MSFVWPCLFALFIWWFSTGLVILLDRKVGLAEPVRRVSGLAIVALSIAVMVWSADIASTQAAYMGFLAGITLWGWHELGFLSGRVTGPNPVPCPPGLAGFARFKAALGTILWHELAIAATALVLIFVFQDAVNTVCLATFLILWALRLSAKINIFLGVPNMTVDLLPENLDFLKSHFRKRSMNWFFPVSVIAATVTAGWLAHGAFQPGATPFEVTSSALLATLVALGMIEHWFMVLPVPDAALWRWVPGVNMTSDKPQTNQPMAADPMSADPTVKPAL